MSLYLFDIFGMRFSRCMCHLRDKAAYLYAVSGDKGIRTLDPLLARQVLSQLSYTPVILAPTYLPMPSPA